ncbi:MAG TPA: M56 family metallopeptidase, partial [Bacillota bacterium]|nr:M56 family metallopeptidase [Bacillota bacterium]
MIGAFSTVLEMTVKASLVALAVMLIRPFLRKSPRVFSYVLWLVVLFRLVCPFSIESDISVIPVSEIGTQVHQMITESINLADTGQWN